MTTPVTLTSPRRGGIHPIFGLFMGGSDLDDDYKLKSQAPYKLTTQLRNPKQSGSSEQSLMDARTDATKLKFHGKLETSADCTTEYDKEEFLTALREQVNYYGLQNFYAMPDEDGKMRNLIVDSHLFDLESVKDEYESRLLRPTPVLDANQQETPDSIQARFKTYDEYERYDWALSQLVIESLISTPFRETIKTRFSHYDDFDDLPGQVYFMMVLDACNTSAAIDIEGAGKAFDALTLSSFPGENVSALATSALKYIKVMKGAYALPPKLGTTLLLKVSKTSSEIFNRNILNYYADMDEMETKFYLKDPRLMEADAMYPTHGPVGCCGYIQDEYSKLFKHGRWPALTPVQVPEGNNSGVIDNPLPPLKDDPDPPPRRWKALFQLWW